MSVCKEIGADISTEVSWEGETIPCRITFMKRKSISMTLAAADFLQVKAPAFYSEKQALEFVEKHRQKVLQWWKKAKSSPAASFQFLDGDTLYLWGAKCCLRMGKGPFRRNRGVLVREGELLVFGSGGETQRIRQMLMEFYKQQTREKAKAFLDGYSQKAGASYESFQAREQKSRWGSCSAQGKISLNCRLAMLPLWALDYICAHEVCHLIHMNHSKEYYHLLEKLAPDYKEKKQMLHQAASQYMAF